MGNYILVMHGEYGAGGPAGGDIEAYLIDSSNGVWVCRPSGAIEQVGTLPGTSYFAASYGAATHCLASSVDGIWETTDGGVTWTAIPITGAIAAQQARGARDLWVAGGCDASHSLDGGAWTVEFTATEGTGGAGLVSDSYVYFNLLVGEDYYTYAYTDAGSVLGSTPNVSGVATFGSRILTQALSYGAFGLMDGGSVVATSGLPSGLEPGWVAYDGTNAVLNGFYRSGAGRPGDNLHHFYRSTDNGATWTDVLSFSGMTSAFWGHVVACGTTPGVFWCLGSGGLYRSADGGATWTLNAGGPAEGAINAFAGAGTPEGRTIS